MKQMKQFVTISFIIAFAIMANAQTGINKNKTVGHKTTKQSRGSGQYHGSRDTTPGSPMGTGGAGGGEMSGSPAGSASETAIQSNTETQSTEQSGSEGLKAKKAAHKRGNGKSKKKKM